MPSVWRKSKWWKEFLLKIWKGLRFVDVKFFSPFFHFLNSSVLHKEILVFFCVFIIHAIICKVMSLFARYCSFTNKLSRFCRLLLLVYISFWFLAYQIRDEKKTRRAIDKIHTYTLFLRAHLPTPPFWLQPRMGGERIFRGGWKIFEREPRVMHKKKCTPFTLS